MICSSPLLDRLPGCASAQRVSARRRLRRLAVVLVLLLAPLALSASAMAGTSPGVAAGARLSDEQTHTYWAHSKLRAQILRLPAPTSRPIARVHYLTEDGFPEVYLVLRRWTDPDGRTWLKLRIPMRPNGRTGWVRDFALGRLHLVRTRLVVDRVALRATLYLIRPADLAVRHRGRCAEHPHTGGPLLDPGANQGAELGRELRALGVWQQRLFGPERLARGRGDRHPRHEPAATDPRATLPRLHTCGELGDQPACAPDADRHARTDQISVEAPIPGALLRGRGRVRPAA